MLPFVPLNDAGVDLPHLDAQAVGRAVGKVKTLEIDLKVTGAEVFQRTGMAEKDLAQSQPVRAELRGRVEIDFAGFAVLS